MDNEADIQVRVQTQGNIDKAILRLSVQDENGQRISDFEQTVSENGICKIKKTSYQYTFMDSGNPSAIYTRGLLM